MKNAVEEKEIKQKDFKFERVGEGEPYYYIFLCDDLKVEESTENCVSFDNDVFALNNYFHSRERAEEVTKKIKMILKLERLHDTFCPDYVPDFTDEFENKYHVFRSLEDTWVTSFYDVSQDAVNVYFQTEEIAQKVCDILNSEKEEK